MYGTNSFFLLKYSEAFILPMDFPISMTWEPVSFVGFNSMGFIHTSVSIPAASACMACALPISRPSGVMYEFNAIF